MPNTFRHAVRAISVQSVPDRCTVVTEDKHLCEQCIYCSQCKKPFTADNINSAVKVASFYVHFKCE